MHKEHPILFSAPMVRAILDGRKTQTRRIVKGVLNNNRLQLKDRQLHVLDAVDFCKHGKVGDRLYVRETWQHSNHPYGPVDKDCAIFYRSDYWDDPHGMDGEKSPEGKYREWRPSIHMPRWASRILLEIVGVRVERLNEISGADCIAEGIVESEAPQYILGLHEAYRDLWESINGPGSWEVNPWVWVIEFKRLDHA